MGNGQRVNTLQFGTGSHTPLASDAFTVVLDDRRGKHVDGVGLKMNQLDEVLGHNLVFRSEFLQFTTPVAVTFGTVGIVFRQQQFDNMFPGVTYFQTIGQYLHTLFARSSAGCREPFLTNHLDHTHPAVAGHTQVFMVTEGWDDDPVLLCGIQNHGALIDLNIVSVQRDIYLISCHIVSVFRISKSSLP